MRFKIVRRGMIRSVFGRLAVAIAVALFFVLRGVFGGVSYHAQVLKTSVETYTFFGHPLSLPIMNTSSVVEATFNPILHPFHWIAGRGSWVDEYSSIVGNSHGGEAHYGKQYSAQDGDQRVQRSGWVSPEDNFEYAVLDMAFWGVMENFAILLSVTITIEILKQRFFYIVLLAGIIGFSLAGIVGTVTGLAVGTIFFLIYKLKSRKENIFAKL